MLTQSRHEFLAALHALLRPEVYLEIGVQYGLSLNLAMNAQLAIGVDPLPQTRAHGNQRLHPVTSNDFFTYYVDPELKVDFAFIDGSHLFEDALRDFINVEAHSKPGTVVVFDDVLPYTQEMTSRTMVPGHWTGDVWKVYPAIRETRPDLTMVLVDTEPTGTLTVWGLSPGNQSLSSRYYDMLDGYRLLETVPDEVIQRTHALKPEAVLTQLAEWRAQHETGVAADSAGGRADNIHLTNG